MNNTLEKYVYNSLVFEYGMSEEQCQRDDMEDYSNIIYPFKDFFNFFNICDGHGGFYVSKFINNSFHYYLKKKIESYLSFHKTKPTSSIMKQIIVDLCEELDTKIKNTPYGENTGSTFAAIFFYENLLYAINIGDSIITVYQHGKLVFKNKEHKPDDKKEKKRILKNYTIVNGRINGKINISRAFGDFKFKKYSRPEENAIICTPDITIFNKKHLFEKDSNSWILLGSDGLLIGDISYKFLTTAIECLIVSGFSASYITQLIVEQYKNENTKDNVSIILLILCKPKIDNNLQTRIFDIKHVFISKLKSKLKNINLEFPTISKSNKLHYLEEYYNLINRSINEDKILNYIFKLFKEPIIKEFSEFVV